MTNKRIFSLGKVCLQKTLRFLVGYAIIGIEKIKNGY
jgi:hypothetical protein